jgi:hypothetical protein
LFAPYTIFKNPSKSLILDFSFNAVNMSSVVHLQNVASGVCNTAFSSQTNGSFSVYQGPTPNEKS